MACEGKVGPSAEGIGKAFADALLSQGAKVCVCDFNAGLGKETVKSFEDKYGEDRVFFNKCDITKDKELQATFQAVKHKFGGFHIVVNNAGILDEIDWRKMEYGILQIHGMPVYTATKHAVIGFTRSRADNHHYQQVRLSFVCICPGGVQTTLFDKDGNVPRLNFQSESDGTKHLIDKFGTMSANKFGEAFLQLLAKSSPNGAIVTVSRERGIRIAHPDVSEVATLD